MPSPLLATPSQKTIVIASARLCAWQSRAIKPTLIQTTLARRSALRFAMTIFLGEACDLNQTELPPALKSFKWAFLPQPPIPQPFDLLSSGDVREKV